MGDIAALAYYFTRDAVWMLDDEEVAEFGFVFFEESLGDDFGLWAAALFVGEDDDEVVVVVGSGEDGLDGGCEDVEGLVIHGDDDGVVELGGFWEGVLVGGDEAEVFDVAREVEAGVGVELVTEELVAGVGVFELV